MDEMEFTPSTETTEAEAPVTEVTSAMPQVKKEARRWKPLGEEFFLDQEFAELVVELGEEGRGPVMFDIQDEEKDGVAGHALIATAFV